MRVTPGTTPRPLGKAFTANSTNGTAFSAKAVTNTKPSGSGVVSIESDTPTLSKWIFFGAGNADQTFNARITGWTPCVPSSAGVTSWVPIILWQGVVTLGSHTGIASGAVLNTEKFADTIETDTGFGDDGVDCQPFSPANDTVAHLLVDNKGCSLLELEVDMVDATNANALIAGV